MRRLAVPLLIACAWSAGEVRLAASGVFSDVPVPGGLAELARVLDLPALPERGRVVVELTRMLYDSEPGKSPSSDGRLARLSAHFDSALRHDKTESPPGSDTVPMPLTPAVWGTGILHRRVGSNALLPAVLLDRRAALVAHGLFALDDETLTYFSSRPELLDHVYNRASGTFAAFGEAVRIEGGRVRVPGGAAAEPLWQAVVGESAAEPDRFVRALLDRREGRVAYLFHALTHLDAARSAFALGLWMHDPALRQERFKALVDSLGLFPGLEPELRPFSRPAEDVVVLLTRMRTGPDGAPAPPHWRRLWRRAFESMDVPSDRARLVRDLEEDGLVDAAWLSQMLGAVDFRFRGERLDQISFGQRVFGSADASSLPDVIAALRAFPVSRMLMLTLERIGSRTPALYVAAARRAEELSSLDRERGVAALSQFQGAAALLERLVRVRSVDARTAEKLTSTLVALPLSAGRYAGGVGRWLRDELGPAIHVEDPAADRSWFRALAGPPPNRPVRVMWEDEPYRLDFGAPEERRIGRAFQNAGAMPLGRAFRTLTIAESLLSPSRTLADVQSAADRLAALGADRRDVASRVMHDLARITRAKDLSDASDAGRQLLVSVDDDLAESLRALVYALTDGNAEDDSTPGLAGVSDRHDFGLGVVRSEIRMRAPWNEPSESFGGGSPWHVTGSLLGLDLGLPSQALRSLAVTATPVAPVLSTTEARAFARTVVLLNARALADADVDGMLEIIGRGRARLAALATAPARFASLADEVRLDGWRRRLVEESLATDPAAAASYLSMAELLVLGNPAPSIPLDVWGVAGIDADGCLCTRFVTPGLWSVLAGRTKTSILGSQVPDLTLRVAEHLHTLGLPGALLKDVLAFVALDYVDAVKPLHPYDWLTLVQSAQAFSADRVTEIVASLTAFGPLVPDRTVPERLEQ